ncbi:MAG TPA: restriction endonuclease subunit S [Sulfurihydrogenibium sp.]|uniref:restriction endonuclease subunit S n=1 Tax=Sulfurihydrogenibium sp. (strain YO3AOP1) TaxID=436114 RepID=UPI0001723F0D|nr:restriction endonuclease subunit S [Sulfurihydrogenibium sp. YO3AOP1]ACD66965.1 restriction modification system DNA specificity domain [Sulfurihydrogenibium sp. YO3AOP1]HBT99438.1 restriction endonuclease subunit S [Sulfurihydrogenibium sp.]
MKESKGFKETEIGLIPEDWEVVRLGEILEEKNEKVKNYDFKNIVVLSITSKDGLIEQNRKFKHRVASQNISDYKLVRKGELVYGFPINEGVIAFLWRYEMGAVSPAYYTWKLKYPEKTYYIFLDYLLRSPIILNLFKPFISNTVHRRKIIKPHDFKQIPIPLPPLEEQKAIADILSTVQNAIEKTEKVINATKQLKKSMMKHLFTYGAVVVDEIDKVKLKESEIGLIPEHWEVVRFGDIVNFKIGRTSPRKNKDYWTNGKYYWVSISDMKNRYINNTSEMVSEKAHKEIFKEKLTPAGTLLMSFKLTIGRTAILNVDAYHNEAIISIYPKENKVLKEFLFYYLPAVDYSNLQDKAIKGNTLNTSKLNKIPIPLPLLDEQQKIANILTTIDQKIQAEEKKKEALQNLFKTLLQQLMTGKIRVRYPS